MSSSTPFTLKHDSNNNEFAQRQKAVFDQLGTLETHLSTSRMDTHEYAGARVTARSQRDNTKQFRGRESLFKRPTEPAPRRNFIKRMPDFKKNPHKWTKYSLEDVKPEDMTDQANTKAALSFLHELRKRKNSESEDVPLDTSKPQKFIFKQQSKSTIEISEKLERQEKDDEKSNEYRGSKLFMAEYVVGQQQKVKKTRKIVAESKGDSKSQLKLDHLFDEED